MDAYETKTNINSVAFILWAIRNISKNRISKV